MASVQAVKLAQMVDLALGTPELGAVNFNVLHTLLHAILSKLNIGEVLAEIDEEDHRTLKGSTAKPGPKVHFQDDAESVVTVDSGVDSVPGSAKPPVVPRQAETYHALKERVQSMERQLEALNGLPKNKEIFEKVFSTTTTAPSEPSSEKRMVSDLWQMVTLRRRVDANEEGLGRLSSLIDDLMREMRKLQKDNEQLRKAMEDMSDMSKLWDKINGFEHAMKTMKEELDKVSSHLALLPSLEKFKDFVSWDSLEKSLRGLRDELDRIKKEGEKVVVEMATDAPSVKTENINAETDGTPPKEQNIVKSVSVGTPRLETKTVKVGSDGTFIEEMKSMKAASVDPMTRPASAATDTSGPSEALMEMLETLGKLSDRHESLEVRVDDVEKELPNKADKKDLENFKIPDDLLQRLADMKMQVDNMMTLRNRDNEAMSRIREALNHLQREMEHVNELIQGFSDGNSQMLKNIQDLFNITTDHEGRKADMTYVDEKVEFMMGTKAEKKSLDTKVNFALFDETTGNLHKLIEDLLQKLLVSEEDLRKLLSDLTGEMDGKLDRMELEPLKDWLEKRLKALAARIKSGGIGDISEDEAAGLKKQLLQHFHCISCDRPIDMPPQQPPVVLPDKGGMPASKSLRPYTTFEMESIRQHARNVQFVSPQKMRIGGEIVDVYYTPRACGGSHTTTYPTKRIGKMTNTNNACEDENTGGSGKPHREELDLQGVDGHIYKGRIDRLYTSQPPDDSKLPPVSTQGPGAAGGVMKASSTDRPRSARSRGQTNGHRGRPMSARAESRPITPGVSELGPAPTPSLDVPQPGIDEEAPVTAGAV